MNGILPNKMAHTAVIEKFKLIDIESSQLIRIPCQFTATESNFLEKLLLEFCISNDRNLTHFNDSLPRKITIDFGQTTFIDSNGLMGLCKIVRLAKDEKIELRFSSFSPQVMMVLSLAGLERITSLENSSKTVAV